MENEPAYKRAGVELKNKSLNQISNSSLDEEGNLNLNSKNPFLQDNID